MDKNRKGLLFMWLIFAILMVLASYLIPIMYEGG